MSIFSKSVQVVLGSMLAFSAQAVTINYENWVYNNSPEEVNWGVTIDDTSNAGLFTFNVGILNPSSYQGDITGFGFNTELNYGSSILNDITNVSATNGTTPTPIVFGDCSGNCNWSGTAAKDPKYSFSVGSPGANSGGSTDVYTGFSFAIPDLGVTLSENTFSLVAIRGQSIGLGELGGGSVKDYSATGVVVGGGHSVPELNASMAPLSAALLMGLMLFGAERRRKKLD